MPLSALQERCLTPTFFACRSTGFEGIITIGWFNRHGASADNMRSVFRASGDSYQGIASAMPPIPFEGAPLGAGVKVSIPIRNSDPSHAVAGQRTFFVTSSTWAKIGLLQSARAATLFIDVLNHYRKQQKFLLHEFVVMPDHFHVLTTLGSEINVEKAVQLIEGGFAFRAGRELGFRAPVWQKGFSEVRVNDQEAFLKIREYIHANPVKKFLAATERDYPYSSANPMFELDAPPQRLKAGRECAAFGIAKAMP